MPCTRGWRVKLNMTLIKVVRSDKTPAQNDTDGMSETRHEFDDEPERSQNYCSPPARTTQRRLYK